MNRVPNGLGLCVVAIVLSGCPSPRPGAPPAEPSGGSERVAPPRRPQPVGADATPAVEPPACGIG